MFTQDDLGQKKKNTTDKLELLKTNAFTGGWGRDEDTIVKNIFSKNDQQNIFMSQLIIIMDEPKDWRDSESSTLGHGKVILAVALLSAQLNLS